MKKLLVRNKTLHVHTFNLPAVKTCPGATLWCKKYCYALKGCFAFPSAPKAHNRNFAATKDTLNFTVEMTVELRKIRASQIRIHSSGDFYSPEYIETWIKIAKLNPNKIFTAYTRSWVLPALLPALQRLGRHPNVVLWYSVDPSTPELPSGGRVSYIEGTEGACQPNCLKQKSKDHNCTTCGHCWSKKSRKVCFKIH